MCYHCDIHRILAERYRLVAVGASGEEQARFVELAEVHERHLADYLKAHEEARRTEP